MPVVLQPTTAVQSFSQAADADPWTFSVTVDQCPNRTLVVSVMLEGSGASGDRSVVGMTYAGQPLSKVDSQATPSWGACEVWTIHDPPVGTASLVVDLNGTDKGVCAALVGQRVDERIASSRIRTPSKTSGNAGTSASVTVAGVTADDLVFSALHIDSTGHATAPGADQTEVVDRESSAGTNTGVVNTQPGSAGGVMSNTWTGSNPYALIAAAFQGAPPGVASGYSEFAGAGSATCDVFRIPGVDVASGDGFVAYCLVRPRNIGVRSMSLLEFRSVDNIDRLLLEIDSGGAYGWANQTGQFLGDGYHYAQEELWTLVIFEKEPGGSSNVNLHVCEDPDGTAFGGTYGGPYWYHYNIGFDGDPDESANGILSVSNFDFAGLTGDIAMWGVWNADWLVNGEPTSDIEAAFASLSTDALLALPNPPTAHFELTNHGEMVDLPGNGCWLDSATAPVVEDSTVPWTFTGGGGPDTTAPTPNVTVVSVAKISRVAGKDSTDVTFTSNEDFVEYDVRRVSSTSDTHTMGTRIETATVSARSSHTITITDDELVAASGAEGSNLLKVFVKDAAGNWSV